MVPPPDPIEWWNIVPIATGTIAWSGQSGDDIPLTLVKELPLQTILLRLGLRFRKSGDEKQFYRRFVLGNLPFTQIALFLGGILYYVFFLWDRVIDPVGGASTQLARGAVGLAVWFGAASLYVRALQPHAEFVSIAIATFAALALAGIFMMLEHGFDYGAVGPVLIMLFTYTALPARLPSYAAFTVITVAGFLAAQILANNAKPGMMLVNALCVGTAALLGLFSVGVREKIAREQFTTLKALDASKLRIEELLYSMLPQEIVRRIQAGETTIADAYGEVSIVFADLVGFTDLTKRISPGHLVELLSTLFEAFDAEAERHGIEKIKTMGDSYMAIGGISRVRDERNHAERAAEFALAIHRVAHDIAGRLALPLDIRVGLHVGPVVAGVIGVKKPAFDAWGESVNLASRLEHNATPGGILISESAFWRLHRQFRVKVLDEVDLTGIGPLKVFLLELDQDSS